MRYTDQDKAQNYVQRETHTDLEAPNTPTEAREMGFTGASQNVIDALNAHKVISDRDYQKVVEVSKGRRRTLERLIPGFLRDRVARRHLLLIGGILSTGLLGVSTLAGVASGESLTYGAVTFIKNVVKLLEGIGKSKVVEEVGQQIQSGGKLVAGQAESGLEQIKGQLDSAREQLQDRGLLEVESEKTLETQPGTQTTPENILTYKNGPMVNALSKVLGEDRAEDIVQTIGKGVVPLFGDKYLAPEGQYADGGKYAGVAVPATAGLAAVVAANQANKMVGDIRHVINPESAVNPLRRVDDRAMLRAASSRANSPAERTEAMDAYRHNKQRSDFLAKSAGYLTA